jgi:hypothetical protein
VFSPRQQDEINRAIELAQRQTDLTFMAYVGPATDDSRVFARKTLAALPDPERSVLVVVDPAQRLLEIVAGTVASRVVDERACALAADCAGGIANGILSLAEHARRPRSLHLDNP